MHVFNKPLITLSVLNCYSPNFQRFILMKNANNNKVGMLGDMFLWLVANLKQGVIYFIKQALPPNKSAGSVLKNLSNFVPLCAWKLNNPYYHNIHSRIRIMYGLLATCYVLVILCILVYITTLLYFTPACMYIISISVSRQYSVWHHQ